MGVKLVSTGNYFEELFKEKKDNNDFIEVVEQRESCGSLKSFTRAGSKRNTKFSNTGRKMYLKNMYNRF